MKHFKCKSCGKIQHSSWAGAKDKPCVYCNHESVVEIPYNEYESKEISIESFERFSDAAIEYGKSMKEY
jgi:hypothetical protein